MMNKPSESHKGGLIRARRAFFIPVVSGVRTYKLSLFHQSNTMSRSHPCPCIWGPGLM